MFAGVSTSCFYPALTEDAFHFLVSQGVKALEVFVNCQLETTPTFLQPIKEQLDQAGGNVLSVHPYTSGEEGRFFFGLYPRRVEESRDLYRDYYKACNLLGARSLVFHGDRFLTLSEADYFKRFRLVQQDAEEFGVELCLENVWRFRSGDPSLFRSMQEEIPDCKFVLDTKQAVLSGYDPTEFLQTMGGENIHHVHISDHSDGKACMLPGTGSFDIPQFLHQLKESGFTGGVLLELYRNNYSTYDQLIQGYQYLEEQIDRL